MSSAFRWKTFSRRIRSIARFRAVVTIQAPGVRGTPSRGQRSSAVANASCTASSASSRSPRTRVRIATALPHSSRKTRSTSACIASVIAEPGGSRSLPFLRGRDQRGEPDRLVEVGEIGQEDAAEDLLRLGERAVGDEALAVPDPNDLRGVAAVELLARDVRIGLAELLEERDPLRHLLGAELRLLVVREVDPRRVVVVDEQRVLHSCASSGSTCTGRTSTAPCSAPGMRAAQSTASSIDAHSKTK